MPDPEPLNFDFDEWSALARSDPQAFEARRRALLEQFIANAPARRQERLRRLQWRADQIRRTSGTPMAACLRLNRLMLDSVYGPDGLVEALEQLAGELKGTPRPRRTPRTPRILAFPRGTRPPKR